jgi:hypothetical protein
MIITNYEGRELEFATGITIDYENNEKAVKISFNGYIIDVGECLTDHVYYKKKRKSKKIIK